MSGKAASITVTMEEQKAVESLANSRTAPYRQVQRARLVLLAVEGMANTAIAQEVGLVARRGGAVTPAVYWFGWISGSTTPPGKPRQYSDADRLNVLQTACTPKPSGHTHWSVRTLAQATGVGRDTVHQILRQANLKPHRVGTFSRSPDPDFAPKVVDTWLACTSIHQRRPWYYGLLKRHKSKPWIGGSPYCLCAPAR